MAVPLHLHLDIGLHALIRLAPNVQSTFLVIEQLSCQFNVLHDRYIRNQILALILKYSIQQSDQQCLIIIITKQTLE
jgi:hypothetical protein